MARQELIPAEVQAYTERFTTPESAVLAALAAETHRSVARPHMLSGHVQGQLLQMMSSMIRPQRILEIGTYTGYATICLAQGLAAGGWIDTIELDQQLAWVAKRHFEQAGLQHCIRTHFGNAAGLIPQLEGTFDLVFLDADKKQYSHYFDLVIDRMPLGGILIADNVLFHGEVLQPEEEQGSFAKALHLFNQKVLADDRVEVVMLSVRDGLSLIRKTRNQ